MALSVRILLMSGFLRRNVPGLLLVTVISFGFGSGIQFASALHGWFRNDPLWWVNAVAAALSVCAATANGVALIVWIRRSARVQS
jgi:hypothetical protein